MTTILSSISAGNSLTPSGNITPAAIMSRINQITRRELTDIDSYLTTACRKIALRTGVLKASESGTVSASTNTATAPSDLLADSCVDVFYLNEEVMDNITFDEWREGKIKGYCVHSGTIYVSPTSDSDRTYTIYYSKQHPDVGDSIEFPDMYEEAIVQLVAALIYGDYEDEERESYRLNRYERELMQLPSPVMVTQTRKGTRA